METQDEEQMLQILEELQRLQRINLGVLGIDVETQRNGNEEWYVLHALVIEALKKEESGDAWVDIYNFDNLLKINTKMDKLKKLIVKYNGKI